MVKGIEEGRAARSKTFVKDDFWKSYMFHKNAKKPPIFKISKGRVQKAMYAALADVGGGHGNLEAVDGVCTCAPGQSACKALQGSDDWFTVSFGCKVARLYDNYFQILSQPSRGSFFAPKRKGRK